MLLYQVLLSIIYNLSLHFHYIYTNSILCLLTLVFCVIEILVFSISTKYYSYCRIFCLITGIIFSILDNNLLFSFTLTAYIYKHNAHITEKEIAKTMSVKPDDVHLPLDIVYCSHHRGTFYNSIIFHYSKILGLDKIAVNNFYDFPILEVHLYCFKNNG